MKRSYFRPGNAFWLPLLLLLGPFAAAQGQEVVISEFLASNVATLLDVDGDSSDWIELYNPSPAAIQLEGWALTDDSEDPDKWIFPAVELGAGEFLLVFASGKDYRDPAGELHTNFRLSAGGEFLGLVSPGGVLTSRFAPTYPEQLLDASYGFPLARTGRTVVLPETPARFLVPTRASELPRDWESRDFDDSAWLAATNAVGYDLKDEPTVSEWFQTDLGASMSGVNASVFLRVPLVIDENDAVQVLEFRVRYDSAFIIYLNGVELLRENVRRTGYNSSADSARSSEQIPVERTFPVAVPDGVLLPAGNVLAIQAQNDDRRSPDFLFALRVDALRANGLTGDAPSYFSAPTPGWPNPSTGQDGQAAPPRFSMPGTSFSGTLELTLESDSPAAEIRLTINGSLPDDQSELYTDPLMLTEATRITARVFEPGKVPSDPVSHTYLAMDEETLAFTSDLPIFVISSFGRSIGGSALPMHMQVIDVGENGRASMTDARHFIGDGAIKERGSSSAGRQKKSFSVEIRDTLERDRNVEILGFPPESDFVLYGAYNFDRALMRNPFMYRLANQVGRYAVRDRFCEVFVASRSGVVDSSTYMGVYSFLEKIKRGEHRVDVEALPPDALAEPEISGGYILKIDRPDPGDQGFRGAGQEVRYVYPKEEVILERPEQVAWIRDYFDGFHEALRSTTLLDAQNYGDFIDVPSWIDHHILNEFAKNPDGFWLSTYFHKPRGGKIHMGPVWDFDRSLGPNDDERARRPEGWSGVINSNWWGTLLRDEEFLTRRAERWLELRDGAFATERVLGLIEEMRTTLRESQARNFQRWRLALGEGGWEGQVDRLAQWVSDRLVWMDGELIPAPRFSRPGGAVEPGDEIALSVLGGTIYYTVNGPDPRNEEGTLAPEAILYQEPIVITANTRIRARTLLGTDTWSELASESFATDVPELLVTEVMFNPPRFEGDHGSAGNFEYFEVFNAGQDPIDLVGWTYRQDSTRVLFEFTTDEAGVPGTVLDPGEYGVVVRRLSFFRSRYGETPRVFGEFSGTLANSGDTIALDGPLGEPYISFEYQGAWHESADSGGHSLVLHDPAPPRSKWSTAAAWKPSERVGGSPGRSDVVVSGRQLPGDLSQDGKLGVTDGILLLQLIAGRATGPCATPAANNAVANVAGGPFLDLADALRLLNHLFLGGVPPAGGVECVAVDDCPDACGE